MNFDEYIFIITSIMLGGLLYDHSTLYLSGKIIRKCASTDFQSN